MAQASENLSAETTVLTGRFGAAATNAGERLATGPLRRQYGSAMEAAFKAAQDYNRKLLEVFQTNAEANLRLGQALMQNPSPGDNVAAAGRSVRERADLIAGQTRELAALGQEAARRTEASFHVGG